MINYFKRNKPSINKQVVAVIQARMESSRYPGKMLSSIAGKPALQRVIERVKISKSINSIIVATAKTKENKEIEKLCQKLNVSCYQGDMDDVLQRVLDSVESMPDDTILCDITGDCMLLDPLHIDWCVARVQKGYDYASNVVKRSWPDGFDVQAYTKQTLKYISGIITNPIHRSHVGWNIINYHKLAAYKIKITNLPAPHGYALPKLGLTLDEKEDGQLISKIFEHFDDVGKNDFTAIDVIDYIFDNPDLLKINQTIQRKEPGSG